MTIQIHTEEAALERIAQLERRVDGLARSIQETGHRLAEIELLKEQVGNLKIEVEEMREE